MTYAEFERLLAVYGSDRARWPVEARKEAAVLVAHSAQARRLLAETEVLDRVLDHAPLPSLAGEAALSARILTAAQRSPRVVSVRPDGAPLASTARVWPDQPLSQRLRTAGVSGLRFATSRAGLGAMLSAASLAAGVLIGLNDPGQTWLRPMQQLSAALTGAPVTAAAQFDPLDEDTL
jgi:hypothetical protein